MRVAPHARVDDGLFDVLGLHGGPFAALRTAVRLYGGRHLPSPHVAVGRAAHVAVTTAIPCLVEADGDLVGTTPATFTVLPGRLRVLLPPGQGDRRAGVRRRMDGARHLDPAVRRSISSRATHQRRGRPRSRRAGV